MDEKQQLLKEVDFLVGKKITKVVSGGSNGSIVLIYIDTNYVFFLFCAWRISEQSKILATWRDSGEPLIGNLVIETQALNNDSIASIELTELLDLNIKTTSGKTMNVFFDIATNNLDEAYENWLFCNKTKDLIFSITKESKIHIRKYSSS